MERIYLDYAASAPLAPVAKKVIEEFAANPVMGNPSSLHTEGRAAQAVLDKAHTTVGAIFGVHPIEVIFTSGATEANVMAIRGILAAWRRQHPNKTPHVIYTPLEHASWRNVIQSENVEATLVPVSPQGVIASDDVINAIKDTTVLIGCTYVSNEIGTIQPVEAIGKAVESYRQTQKSIWPIFHVDAVQAFPYLNTHFGHMHADAMTISGHKYGALGGIGALLLKKFVPFESVIKGGGQEWGYRAGTENILGAATLAAVMDWHDANREAHTKHVADLQQRLESALPDNVTILGKALPRAPHITYLWLPGITDEHLVHKLDLAGVAVSSGSACSSGAMLPSATLMAMGFSPEEAFGGLRVSFGWETSEGEMQALVKILKEMLEREEGGRK